MNKTALASTGDRRPAIRQARKPAHAQPTATADEVLTELSE